VTVLAVSDGSASLGLLRDNYGIAGLVNPLAKAGIEVVDISLQEPTLEEVFLKLTGKELRD
jgi:hypothetical protein